MQRVSIPLTKPTAQNEYFLVYLIAWLEPQVGRDEYQMDTIKPWVCPDGPQVGKDGSQVGTHGPQVGTEEFSSGG